MLHKGFALVLLILALSPFTAPFQADAGADHQIASIEPLSAIRQHADLRAPATRRLTEPRLVDAISISTPVLSLRVSAGVVTSHRRQHESAGDYFALATVLRL